MKPIKTMDLVRKLVALVDLYGDLPCYIEDDECRDLIISGVTHTSDGFQLDWDME